MTPVVSNVCAGCEDLTMGTGVNDTAHAGLLLRKNSFGSQGPLFQISKGSQANSKGSLHHPCKKKTPKINIHCTNGICAQALWYLVTSGEVSVP